MRTIVAMRRLIWTIRDSLSYRIWRSRRLPTMIWLIIHVALNIKRYHQIIRWRPRCKFQCLKHLASLSLKATARVKSLGMDKKWSSCVDLTEAILPHSWYGTKIIVKSWVNIPHRDVIRPALIASKYSQATIRRAYDARPATQSLISRWRKRLIWQFSVSTLDIVFSFFSHLHGGCVFSSPNRFSLSPSHLLSLNSWHFYADTLCDTVFLRCFFPTQFSKNIKKLY